eukprot:3792515-Rhodomonas_salina.1
MSGLGIQEHWMRIKSQAGPNVMAPTAPVRVPLALLPRRDSAYSAASTEDITSGVDLLDDSSGWTESQLMDIWGEAMNKTGVCRNCAEKGRHSAPFCTKA